MREIYAEACPSQMLIMRIMSATLLPLFFKQQIPAETEEYNRCGGNCLEFGNATNTCWSSKSFKIKSSKNCAQFHSTLKN